MVGENKRDQCVVPPGVDKGLPPIAVADDHLEKMNALEGADDKVTRRMQASEEVVKVSDKDQAKKKKQRFIWTRNVHNCFLDAIKQLGFKRAVPTKILELMNIENLTRENVASHLQKYRLQMKRRDQEQAQARAASENVPKAVHPHVSGIPQQPWVLSNTMQGINMDCACLDGSQLTPSFANHNLNMIQTFPTVQEVYRTPFKDLFDEGVNRMSSVRLVHGLYDSNGPHDINKIGYSYSLLTPKPLVDSYSHNLMDRHDTTLVPQYDRRDELSRQGIISPFVPQYDRRDELSLQGIISPSFIPQYDRCDELFVADQGSISPLLAQNMEGLGVGVPRPPEAIGGLIGMNVEGVGQGVPRLPEATGMKVEGVGLGVPRLPEGTGGLIGMKVKGRGLGVPCLPEATGGLDGHVPCLPEATGALAGMKVEGLGAGVTHLPEATGGPGLGVPCPPEATGALAGMKVGGLGAGVTYLPEATGGPGLVVPCPPEATGALVGMKVEGPGAGVTHLPEATGGPGLGVPRTPEASGGLAGMNDFQQGFSIEELEIALDSNDFWMNMKGDVDGKSLDDLFRR